ncbi:polysaccharide deacetylase family protein [Aciduricibacillus chroicocephali]|uniref:Polysaccharide deacetylase family protein n=1 Tax=Aciduricibacillus chroicocephali TaxID=3054939 RepID=A0ABY9L1Q6_9BACI|nr:polysaccharide deacetylase family protein [Bacillaceae bacterium 44XB]
MYHLRNLATVLIFVTMVLLAGNRFYMPFGKENGDLLVKEAALLEAGQEDALLKKIKEEAKLREEKPEDAYIDRVWKKTPGRSGIKIDIQESYKQMKKKGEFDPNLLLKKEVTPATGLSDLPPSPIYRGHPKKEMAALLINVSWGTEYIPSMLKTLKEENARASFFIEGKWAKEHPDLVKMIADEGHLIGNHAYSHPDMSRITAEEMKYQIAETNKIIEAIIKKKPVWFAPPSGSFNEQVVKIAAKEDMHTILWTVDTIDWKNPTVSVMLNRVETKLHPGATILMHPTKATATGLGPMIKSIRAKGLKLGTIEKLTSPSR